MGVDNPVIKLCIEGSRAEFDGRLDDAHRLYRQAWEESQNDYEACIAAHYVARRQASSEETLRWNQEALRRAGAVGDDRVKDFYASFYVNLGQSYEVLGNDAGAQRYYDLAAQHGLVHRAD